MNAELTDDADPPLWWLHAPVGFLSEAEKLEAEVEEWGAQMGVVQEPAWYMRLPALDRSQVLCLRTALDNTSGERGVQARRECAGLVKEFETFLSVGDLTDIELKEPRELPYAPRRPREEVLSEKERTPELIASATSEEAAWELARQFRQHGLRVTIWDPYLWYTVAISRTGAMWLRAGLVAEDSWVLNEDRYHDDFFWSFLTPEEARAGYSLEGFDEFLNLSRPEQT